MKTKKCTICGLEKNEDMFVVRKTNEDGTKVYRNECKDCMTKKQNERRQQNRENKGIAKRKYGKNQMNIENIKPSIPSIDNELSILTQNYKNRLSDVKAGETMDRISKNTSKRVGDTSKKMNLKKSNLISALVEWGLNKMENDVIIRQEIVEIYFNIK